MALGEPNDRRGGWIPSDPFVPFPAATMSRHDLLRELHQQIQPRTYLEIGVSNGQSLSLSRARSIGIDPEFRVAYPIHCDLDLVREKSDTFLAVPTLSLISRAWRWTSPSSTVCIYRSSHCVTS